MNDKTKDETMETRVFYKHVKDITCEWEDLIEELSMKEIEHYMLKENYNLLSEDIIASTDFKQLYGKNNESIRKAHVKKELTDIVEQIKTLEFSIDYLKRRISLLKAMTYIKMGVLDI